MKNIKIIFIILFFLPFQLGWGQEVIKLQMLTAVEQNDYHQVEKLFGELTRYFYAENKEHEVYKTLADKEYYPVLKYLVKLGLVKPTDTYREYEEDPVSTRYFIEYALEYNDTAYYKEQLQSIKNDEPNLLKESYYAEEICYFAGKLDDLDGVKLLLKKGVGVESFNCLSLAIDRKIKILDILFKYDSLNIPKDQILIGAIGLRDTAYINLILDKYLPEGLNRYLLDESSQYVILKAVENKSNYTSDELFYSNIGYISWLMENKKMNRIDKEFIHKDCILQFPLFLDYLLQKHYLNVRHISLYGYTPLEIIFFRFLPCPDNPNDESVSHQAFVYNSETDGVDMMRGAEVLINHGGTIEQKEKINILSQDGYSILDFALYYKASQKVIDYLKSIGAKTSEEIKVIKRM